MYGFSDGIKSHHVIKLKTEDSHSHQNRRQWDWGLWANRFSIHLSTRAATEGTHSSRMLRVQTFIRPLLHLPELLFGTRVLALTEWTGIVALLGGTCVCVYVCVLEGRTCVVLACVRKCQLSSSTTHEDLRLTTTNDVHALRLFIQWVDLTHVCKSECTLWKHISRVQEDRLIRCLAANLYSIQRRAEMKQDLCDVYDWFNSMWFPLSKRW